MKNLMSSFFRACLALALLTALLCFAQCKNDDNGGDGNGGTTPGPDPDPDPGPIYLWVTSCHVDGDMNVTTGSSCPTSVTGTTGTAKADSICAQR